MIARHCSMSARCWSTLNHPLSQSAPSARVTSSRWRGKNGIRVCTAATIFTDSDLHTPRLMLGRELRRALSARTDYHPSTMRNTSSLVLAIVLSTVSSTASWGQVNCAEPIPSGATAADIQGCLNAGGTVVLQDGGVYDIDTTLEIFVYGTVLRGETTEDNRPPWAGPWSSRTEACTTSTPRLKSSSMALS